MKRFRHVPVHVRLFALLGLVLLPAVVRANVYPSGLKVDDDNGTISSCETAKIRYVLNEDANGFAANPGLKVEVVNSSNVVVRTLTYTAPADALATKGVHTFVWDGLKDDLTAAPDGNYTVRLTTADNGYGSWTSISTDTTLTNFELPRGVVVNTNPAAGELYGRVYVAQGRACNTGAGRVMNDGIYILNADLSDTGIPGGTGPKTGGVNWSLDPAGCGTSTGGNGPFRLFIGPDDSLYISDWSDQQHSGLWVADANVTTATEVLDSTAGRDTNGLVTGVHGSVPTVYVEGTGAARTIYTMDEDYPSASSSQKGSILQYAIGTATSTSTSPTFFYDDDLALSRNFILNSHNDLVRASDGTWWLSQRRDGNASAELSLMQVSSDGTTVLWRSVPDLAANSGSDPLRRTRGIAWDPVNDWLGLVTSRADGANFGLIIIFDDDTKSIVTSFPFNASGTSGSTGTDIAFDAAGNVYVGNQSAEFVRVWSPPTGNNTNTTTSGVFTLNKGGASGGPSISQQPQSQSVCQGDDPTFSVTASGSGTLSYQWFRNGAPIGGATGTSYQLIDAAFPADNGAVFHVEICDSTGVKVSDPATLTVAGDPSITQDPITHVVAAGGSANYSADGVSAIPNPNDGITYQWMKNNSPLSNGPGVSGATTATLSLTNVQLADDGATFHLVITDTCNKTASSTKGWLFVETPACNDPFADSDLDGDVDLVDFAVWQACRTAGGGPLVNSNICHCYDRNHDGDVDSASPPAGTDFADFLACYSGPTVNALATCDGTGGATLYSDNFDAGTSAGTWTVFAAAAGTTSSEFAFDYSTQSIPSAPNSTGGTTVGLRLKADGGTGISAYPNGQNFSGNYRLKFDMWMNYNNGPGGGVGSTHHARAGINTAGTQVMSDLPAPPTGDGFTMAVTGEGGTLLDYIFYVGTTLQPAGPVYFAPGGSQNEVDPYYQALFPSPTYESQGAPGKHWVTVEISQIGGVISWKLNGAPIASKADVTFTSGNIMLGYMDRIAGAANPPEPQFVIYDNVRVISD